MMVDCSDCKMASRMAAWWVSRMVGHLVVRMASRSVGQSGWKMAAMKVVDSDDSRVASLGV